MGWIQSCIASLEFNKTSFSSEGDVEDEIRQNEDTIKYLTNCLVAYVASNPRDHKKDDESFEETIERLGNKVQNIVKDIVELSEESTRFQLLKDNWDLRDGDYTYNPQYRENLKKFIQEEVLPSLNWQEELKAKYTKKA